LPDRLPFSHRRLEVAIKDSVATSSSRSVATTPDLGHETVTAADAELAPIAAATSSATSGTTASVETEPPAVRGPAHRVTVSSGDSLYLIFKRLGLPQRDLALMTGTKPLAKKLARIAPRQEIEFYIDTQSRLTRLVHRLDQIRSLHIFRNGDTFTFEEVVEPPEVSIAAVTGIIDSSLFEAGQRAGLSDRIIMQMAEIFGWDVDFVLDIRAGDRLL
jgi:cell envelope opacity-associated protein A